MRMNTGKQSGLREKPFSDKTMGFKTCTNKSRQTGRERLSRSVRGFSVDVYINVRREEFCRRAVGISMRISSIADGERDISCHDDGDLSTQDLSDCSLSLALRCCETSILLFRFSLFILPPAPGPVFHPALMRARTQNLPRKKNTHTHSR